MTTDEIPFVAIGNDELGDPLGNTIRCRECGGQHSVEYGESVSPDGTKKHTTVIAFYRCSGKTYIAGINGREWGPE